MLKSRRLSENSKKQKGVLVLWIFLSSVLVASITLVAYAESLGAGIGLVGTAGLAIGTLLYADHAWRALPQHWKKFSPNSTRAFVFLAPASLALLLRAVVNAL
jgi:hypothetical protein